MHPQRLVAGPQVTRAETCGTPPKQVGPPHRCGNTPTGRMGRHPAELHSPALFPPRRRPRLFRLEIAGLTPVGRLHPGAGTGGHGRTSNAVLVVIAAQPRWDW